MQLAYIGLLFGGALALCAPNAHAAPKAPAKQASVELSTGAESKFSRVVPRTAAKRPSLNPRAKLAPIKVAAPAKKSSPAPRSATPVLKEGDSKTRRRIIQIWGHGCFMATGNGSWECYGSVDNWESKSQAELKAKSLADEAAKEVLRNHPGSIIHRKVEVKKTESGKWDAEVTLQIAVANQLALL